MLCDSRRAAKAAAGQKAVHEEASAGRNGILKKTDRGLCTGLRLGLMRQRRDQLSKPFGMFGADDLDRVVYAVGADAGEAAIHEAAHLVPRSAAE